MTDVSVIVFSASAVMAGVGLAAGFYLGTYRSSLLEGRLKIEEEAHQSALIIIADKNTEIAQLQKRLADNPVLTPEQKTKVLDHVAELLRVVKISGNEAIEWSTNTSKSKEKIKDLQNAVNNAAQNRGFRTRPRPGTLFDDAFFNIWGV